MHGQVSDDARDPSTQRSRPPILSVFLAMGVAAIFADLALGGILLRVDEGVAQVWTFQGARQYPTVDSFDPIGQRLVCLPILFGVAFWLSRRLSSIRPLVIALGGTLLLNLVIGLVKIATERESPRTGGPELFSGDNVLFPSGHTANVIFVYGLAAALLIKYGSVSRRTGRILVALVVATFVFMTWVSVYRHTHWFSDLIAGGMIAGAVLELTLRVDSEWTLVRGWLKRLVGPAWSLVELVVGRVRPVVIRDDSTPPSSGVRLGDQDRPVEQVPGEQDVGKRPGSGGKREGRADRGEANPDPRRRPGAEREPEPTAGRRR